MALQVFYHALVEISGSISAEDMDLILKWKIGNPYALITLMAVTGMKVRYEDTQNCPVGVAVLQPTNCQCLSVTGRFSSEVML